MLLADTGARGSKKYAQGNYLKGSNWRQYFRPQFVTLNASKPGASMTPKALATEEFCLERLMACHCISTAWTDDRFDHAI
jgi:hypothetical protein